MHSPYFRKIYTHLSIFVQFTFIPSFSLYVFLLPPYFDLDAFTSRPTGRVLIQPFGGKYGDTAFEEMDNALTPAWLQRSL